MIKEETSSEKLYRIENILANLDRLTKNKYYQKTIGINELNRRTIEAIKRVI